MPPPDFGFMISTGCRGRGAAGVRRRGASRSRGRARARSAAERRSGDAERPPRPTRASARASAARRMPTTNSDEATDDRDRVRRPTGPGGTPRPSAATIATTSTDAGGQRCARVRRRARRRRPRPRRQRDERDRGGEPLGPEGSRLHAATRHVRLPRRSAIVPVSCRYASTALRRASGRSGSGRSSGSARSGRSSAGPGPSSRRTRGVMPRAFEVLVEVSQHVGGGGVDVGDRLGRDDDPRRRRSAAASARICSRNVRALAKNSGASKRKITQPGQQLGVRVAAHVVVARAGRRPGPSDGLVRPPRPPEHVDDREARRRWRCPAARRAARRRGTPRCDSENSVRR